MLAAMTSVKGSAGYVAMEKVRGTLSGRSGTFVLQHSAIMDRGTPQLTIIVVPDSAPTSLRLNWKDEYHHHRRKTFLRIRLLSARQSMNNASWPWPDSMDALVAAPIIMIWSGK